MALISIDGTDLPTSSEYGWGLQDISKAERNARGTMIMERITTKRKLELSWKYLSAADLAAVLTALSPVFKTVIYMDPMDNDFKTGTFYNGDRSVGMIDYVGGVPRYKDLKFNLIER